MEPVFTLPYSEFAVVQEIGLHLKKGDGFSAYVPLSRQQKGVDFVIHNHNQVTNKYARFQVKASRPHPPRESSRYQYTLLFNNFIGNYSEGACDFYCLFGLYPDYVSSERISDKNAAWHHLVLCMADTEMKRFLEGVRTKKDPLKADKFFYVELGAIKKGQPSIVEATRGLSKPRDLREYLLPSRIDDIRRFLS